jgi:hypothetical protein
VVIDGREISVSGRLMRIARLSADGYEFLDDPSDTLAALRTAPHRVDCFTFVQHLPETFPKFRYHTEWDNVAAVPVSTYDEWWSSMISRKTRNMVRRAEKAGVSVHEVPFDNGLVRGIADIYNECEFRQGRRFWHYGKDLETVRRENGTFVERSVFLGAFWRDELIGFAKLVEDGFRGQAGLMQIISKIRHRDKSPTNALVAHAVRACAERRIPYLVYSNFSYGTKERDSLRDFKEHNGFRRIEVPRYYVPLTRAGAVGLRLGFHRPLRERIPSPVRTALRAARRAWINRSVRPQSKVAEDEAKAR